MLHVRAQDTMEQRVSVQGNGWSPAYGTLEQTPVWWAEGLVYRDPHPQQSSPSPGVRAPCGCAMICVCMVRPHKPTQEFILKAVS